VTTRLKRGRPLCRVVFILVVQGQMTFYESDDPDCTPIVRAAGQELCVVVDSLSLR